MNNNQKFLWSVLIVFVMGAIMILTSRNAGGDPNIIINLELAPNIGAVEQLLAPYDEDHTGWLRINTLLDFVFIITYSILFFFALRDLARKFAGSVSVPVVAFLALVPGTLDVIENLFILQFLNHWFDTPFFDFYYWCVHIKWALVGVFTLLALLRLGLLIYEQTSGAGGKMSR